MKVYSLVLLHGALRLNLDQQAWWQLPLHDEPSDWPHNSEVFITQESYHFASKVHGRRSILHSVLLLLGLSILVSLVSR